MNGYELSRAWFDWCFDNPELYTSNHTAMYMWVCDKWNRLGQKDKFGLPSLDTMEILKIKSKTTYYSVLNDLVSWGFILVVTKSTNQNTSLVVSLNQKMIRQTFGKRSALDSANAQQLDITVPIIEPITNNNKQVTNMSIALEVISFFNETSGRSMTLLVNREKDINARIKEKHTLEDFKKVIIHKWQQWGNDEKMNVHFKPETLFCKKHFASYLEDANIKQNKISSTIVGKEPNPNHYANEETYIYACKNAGVKPKNYYDAK